jgi:DNA-binding winged helix-turn-helix (wHTH) protein/TolB-like protein
MQERPGDQRTRHRFGVFELDARALELHKNGRVVRVRPQSLKILAMLVERPGQVIRREEIQAEVWGNETFVDFEQGLNHCIRDLRTALGDTADSPRFVQTLPRRGYRFVAPVEGVKPLGTATNRWLILPAIGLTAIVVGLVMASYGAGSRPQPVPNASRLVVMPFSTSSGDPALGTGLATAIAARLAGQPSMVVQSIARTGEAVDEAAGRALALLGEISTSGPNVIVRVRMEDPANGAALWSDRIVVRADQLFSVEDVVAERVVDALNLRLAAADQARLRRRYTSNTAAYEDYLRGRAAIVRYTPDATRDAVQAFESALQRDPGYALARAGLAMACADMYLRFAPAAEIDGWGTRAEAEARAALDSDPNLAEAHLARAAVARKREFDWDATVTASRRALVLNPSLDHARYFMAAAYYHLGYMDEALIEMRKGRDVRGVDVIEPVRIEALVALFSGNFGPARVHLEEVSRLSSRPLGDTYLALAYYYSGSVPRGQAILASLATSASASTATRAGAALAGVLAAQGDAAGARRHIAAVLAREYRDHHVAYSLGAAYAQLREFDAAGRWLRTAADTGFPCTTWVERDPLLEPLRRHPGFPALRTYVQTRRDSTLSRTDSTSQRSGQ